MPDLVTIAFAAAGLALIALACFGWGQPRIALAIERWGQTLPGLDEAAELFYARVYQRLRERLDEAGLPDSTVGFGSGHLFGNRTIFGARPQYLIVRYSHLTIYLYAFRLPAGLYVSYWAFSKYTLWLEHPVLKWLVFWRNYQMTLYQFDVTDMCLATIHNALFEVIDDYTAERGLRPLEEYERRPVLHSFYAKYKQGTLPPLYPTVSAQGGYPQSTYAMPVATGTPAAPQSKAQPVTES